jgi:hypothetical protein
MLRAGLWREKEETQNPTNLGHIRGFDRGCLGFCDHFTKCFGFSIGSLEVFIN